MRIGVVTQNFPCKEQPYRGHSAYQTIRRLLRHAEVEVFCPQLHYPSFLAPKHRPWAKTDTSFCVPDISTTFFHYPALPVVSRPFNGSVCAHYLLPHLRKSKLDLILNYWIYPDGLAAVRCGRELGLPVILKAIGSDINEARGVTRFLTRTALRQADFVLTVSEALRAKVLQMGIAPSKVRASLNGCDQSIFFLSDQMQARADLGLEAQKRYLLFVGRLEASKGLRELVRATAAVSRSIENVHLIMIGEGPLRTELETLVLNQQIQHKVTFVGTLSTQELGQWYAASDVLALPSYNEGCPNVVMEAINSGRPVVATRVGGVPELVTSNCGILVRTRDVAALTKALEEALVRKWDHAAIARSGHRSWEDVADELFTVCEEVLARQASAHAEALLACTTGDSERFSARS